MKFNLTPLEFALFASVCLAITIWTKHGRRIRRWLHDYFRQRRGPRNLKPKSRTLQIPHLGRNPSVFVNSPTRILTTC